MTNVFLSWSGERSKAIAEELRNWIPSVLQFAKPYFTPNDIEKGSKWGSEISKKLADSNVGLICLTKDNINKPWILFEAGALSKDQDRSRVCSVLFGADEADLTGPLATFQNAKFDKSDFKKVVGTINDSAGQSALAKDTFDRVFEMWWPQLEVKIQAIMATEYGLRDSNTRPDREILEEILLTTRSLSRSPRVEPRGMPIPSGLVRDFAEAIEGLMEQNDKFSSMDLNKTAGQLLEILSFLQSNSGARSVDQVERIARLRDMQSNFIPF
jgi:hypothetical protein